MTSSSAAPQLLSQDFQFQLFEKLSVIFDVDPHHNQLKLPWEPIKNVLPDKVGLTCDWHGLVWLNLIAENQALPWLLKMNQHRNGIIVFDENDVLTPHLHNSILACDAYLYFKETEKRPSPFLCAWGNIACQALERLIDQGDFHLFSQSYPECEQKDYEYESQTMY